MGDTPKLIVRRLDRHPVKFVVIAENKVFPHLSPSHGELAEQELRRLLADKYKQSPSQIEALIDQANEQPH
jgi:hypothetical protein